MEADEEEEAEEATSSKSKEVIQADEAPTELPRLRDRSRLMAPVKF